MFQIRTLLSKTMKTNLLVSMSGGRTSAYMTKKLLDNYQDKYNIIVCFANTGQEDNATLDFVNQCDTKFNFNTVWLESVVHQGERTGSTFKVVNYETASRDGKPFEEVISKYGIPNVNYPHCTRELKINPIHNYIKSLGWKTGEYETAIGIRLDEPDRINRTPNSQNIIYPLVDFFPADKRMVLDWWSDQEFDLQLLDYQGNCKWCYKKSNKKLFQLIKDDITIFDCPKRMEKTYGHVGKNVIAGKDSDKPRVFFREYRSTKNLIDFYNATDAKQMSFSFDDEMDSGCSESCEAY